MAAVDYIPVGESISAADMTRLWRELDRRTGILFDNKSFLLSGGGQGFDRRFVGLPFYFNGGGTNWAFQLGLDGAQISYDHSVFTRNAASLTEISRDEEKKIITVANPSDPDYAAIGVDPTYLEFFNHSLEALQRDGYWLKEQYSAFAEKRHNYALAELIFINVIGTFDFPQTWNKFNFFRIHNLSETPLQVAFQNSGFAVIIEPWGCRSVRRTPSGTFYATADPADIWRYFFPLEGGDPRFWTQTRGESFGSNGNAQLLTTLRANNVTNTTLLFDWINAWDFKVQFDLLTGLSTLRLGWYKDPRLAAYNLLSPVISADSTSIASDTTVLTADSDDVHALATYAKIKPGTIMGDLLHQHGRIVYTLDNTAKEIDYKGYQTIAQDFAATGVTLSEDVNGNLVLTGVGTGYAEKLIAIGCNLFASGTSGAYALNPIIDLQGGPVTLDNKRMPVTPIAPIDIAILTRSFTAFPTDEVLLANVPYRAAQYLTADQANPINIHRHSVADVLKLNWLGNASLAANAQDSYTATFSHRRLQWTMFGLVLLMDQILWLGNGFEFSDTTGGPIFSDDNVLRHPINPLTTLDVSTGRVTISNQMLITFDTWGWGDSTNPHCLAPQVGRIYSNLKSILTDTGARSIHPELYNDGETLDGAGFDETDVVQTNTDITAVTPISLVATEGGYFPVWKEPDNLREAIAVIASGKNLDTIHAAEPFGFCPRLPMEFWHFNTLAAWVNALTRIIPMDYTFAPGLQGILPTVTSVGNVLPIDAFSEFSVDSDAPALYAALGIPILSPDDFPDSYQAIRNQTRKRFDGGLGFQDTIIARQASAPLADDPTKQTVIYTLQRKFTGVGFASGADEDLVDPLDHAIGGQIGFLSAYRWVRISDVQAAIEARGWKFFYRGVFLPVSLELFTVSNPTQMYPAPLHDTFTVSQPEFITTGFVNPLGQTYNGTASTFYYNRVPAFVQRSGPTQWKAGTALRVAINFHPGEALMAVVNDDGTNVIFGEPSIGGQGYLANTPGYIKFDVDDAYRKAVVLQGQTYYGTGGTWVANLMIQKQCSAAYAQVEQVVLNPISTVEHITDNWSTISLENAAAADRFFIDHRANGSPLQPRAPIGVATLASVFNGSLNGAVTYLENTVEHSAFQILETLHPNFIIP